jgi:hypothetical protein
MPPNDDYKVGHKRPPKHSQFKPGQSGNPRGRPRGAKDHSKLLNRALDETLPITENGRKGKVTKRVAMYKQLANRAAQGDLRAIQIILRALNTLEERPDWEPAQAPCEFGTVVILPDNGRDQLDPEL